ncbi:type II secretion system protein GspK [Pseudomonas sp. B329]|uniref:type II secretion system protein GspK n=1 Tax=Pseudomonas sp. B329 TaxID=1553459 RepID=UPI002004955B|nr:type II secretion system protein GspK [Pseudomonas sp. B329]
MAGVVDTLRLENRQSAFSLQQAHARLAAQAGLALTIQGLLAYPPYMVADGRVYSIPFEQTRLDIRVGSERGKLDLKFAMPESFALLAHRLGATSEQARQWSQSLRRQRSVGQLTALEQLQQLPQMDARLYEHLLPHITLWSGLTEPDPDAATPALLTLLKLSPSKSAVQRGPESVVNVHVLATTDNQVSASLQAVVFLSPQGGGQQPHRVLRWKE